VVLDALDRVPGLGDGFRAEVTITLFSASDVLQVPASAAFRSEGGWAVFVAENGRMRLRPVTIGHRNDAAVEVLSGLRAGERVLLHPSERVRDGARYAERAPAASGV
jgi:HlyD family secretion protein